MAHPDEFLAGIREELWQNSPEGWVINDVAVGEECRPERCGCQTHQLQWYRMMAFHVDATYLYYHTLVSKQLAYKAKAKNSLTSECQQTV